MKKALIKIAVLTVVFSLALAPSLASAFSFEKPGDLLLPEAPLEDVIVQVINVLLGLLGLIAVILIIIGGFKYMMAGGDDEKIKKAKKMLVTGVIGIIIVILAWVIAQFVIGTIINAAGGV